MARYLHLYEDYDEFDDNYYGENYHEPWLSLTRDGSSFVNYDRREFKTQQYQPLTFTFQEAGTFSFVYDGISNDYIKTVYYSLNNEEIRTATPTRNTPFSIAVVPNDIIYVWGNNAAYSEKDQDSNNFFFIFESTASFKASGNIMSLIQRDGFENLATLTRDTTFKNLFYNCSALTDASGLLLPAIGLAASCYEAMFEGCTGMTKGPKILPATTLTSSCYRQMFKNCTSLKAAPELPALNINNGACMEMFLYCSSLNYVKSLALQVDTNMSTRLWLGGVATSGTFVKNPNMNSWVRGNAGIPAGWTVIDNNA